MRVGKIIAGIAVAAVCAFGCVAVANAGDVKKASVKFETTVHDFGMIKEDGGPVSCEFPLKNVGESNLVVYEARAECGCTKPEFPKAPVAPGKGAIIKVTYNPLGRPGAFDKVVTIKCNGSPSKVRLKIRGTVVPKDR